MYANAEKHQKSRCPFEEFVIFIFDRRHTADQETRPKDLVRKTSATTLHEIEELPCGH